jgi:hypothetical protein
MVLNDIFNDDSVISWWSVLMVDETGESHDLSEVIANLYHIKFSRAGFEFITLVEIGTDYTGSCK